jgi:sirohydrochlorin ferrochelatase
MSVIVLFAHGSSNPDWGQFAYQIQTQMKQEILNQQQIKQVEVAFLEKQKPDLLEVVHQLVEKNPERNILIHVIPLFFAAGTHLLNDLPALAKELEIKYANHLHFRIYPAIGSQPQVQNLLAQACIKLITPN